MSARNPYIQESSSEDEDVGDMNGTSLIAANGEINAPKINEDNKASASTDVEFKTDSEEEEENSDDQLDEEDLELIEENLGVKLPGRASLFKRLKRQHSDEDDNLKYDVDSKSQLNDLFQDDDDDRNFGNTQENLSVYEDEDLEDFLEYDDDDYENENNKFYDRNKDKKFGRFKASKDIKNIRSKKTKSSASFQKTSSALIPGQKWQDVQDIFGDGFEIGDEDEEEDIISNEVHEKSTLMKKAFEPSALVANYFTEKDESIRKTDIPERFQLIQEGDIRKIPTEDELDEEAVWISNHFISEIGTGNYSTILPLIKKSVKNLLKFLRISNYEVPVIALHRKEYYQCILREVSEDLSSFFQESHIWKIYDLDLDWESLKGKKEKIRSIIESTESVEDKEFVNGLLKDVTTNEELCDIQNYLNFYYQQNVSKSSYKRPLKRNVAEIALRFNLDQFVLKFCISAKHFGLNLLESSKEFMPPDFPVESPEELASCFVSSQFPSSESVINASVKLLSSQISYDPNVLKTQREAVNSCIVVSTQPTHKGMKEIEDGNFADNFSRFKCITDKPLSSFKEDEWLVLKKAESSGLLSLSMQVKYSGGSLPQLQGYFGLLDSIDLSPWESLRRRVFDEAIFNLVYPKLMKEADLRMTRECEKWIALSVQSKLSQKLCFSPYVLEKNSILCRTQDDTEIELFDYNAERQTPPNVAAVSWGDGSHGSATFFSIIEGKTGAVLKYLKLDLIQNRELSYIDYDKICESIREFSIKAIAINGFLLNIRKLYSELHKVLSETFRGPDDSVALLFVEDDIAKVFMHMQSSTELTNKPPLMKYTVSLARYLLDPTIETAYVFSFTSDEGDLDPYLLNLHKNQNLISKRLLKISIERALVNRVSEIGVDLNIALNNSRHAALLQFVPGLGRRKAQDLIKNINASNAYVESRYSIISGDFLGKCVYENAASYLRIHEDSLPKNIRNVNIDILDCTRIHPSDYVLAHKMAADAMDVEEAVEEQEGVPSAYVEELLLGGHSLKLTELMLDEYAKQLEKMSGLKKFITLQDIKNELIYPFKDGRARFSGLTMEQLYESAVLSGTEPHLAPGQLVSIIVLKVLDKCAICKIDSSFLTGIIGIRSISNQKIDFISDYIKEGETRIAKITSIQADKFQVDLSIIPAEISKSNIDSTILSSMGEYYDVERHLLAKTNSIKITSEFPAVSSRGGREGGANNLTRGRFINHPLFKNVSREKAEEILSEACQGEVIIRPGSKGPNFLVFSWKVCDNCYQHVYVKEENKPNEAALGRKLIIDDEVFEELDEALTRFLEPLIKSSQDIICHPKFVNGGLESLHESLRKEKAINPKRIAYGIGINPELPGKFVISALAGKAPHNEYISLTKNGLRFRKSFFDDISSLINYFKSHFKVM